MNLLPKGLNKHLTAASFVGLAAMLACTVTLSDVPANATQLPPGVLNYVHQKDAKVQVRFDGVVIFSNGTTYLPVIPQDPAINPDPMGVVNTIPEKVDYPDLIQFDNNFFLIRILQTSSGRLTLPKLATVPVQLKEGLLPQDLVIPNHLYIPDELKIILGELPYKPSLEMATPKVTAAQTIKNAATPAGHNTTATPNQRILYAYDMDRQTLATVDVYKQNATHNISLGCMPSSMVTSADGKYLYAGCLSTNEVVVVDLAASLVKTRIPAGNKPQDLLLLPKAGYLAVSNRFDEKLSLINTKTLLPASAEFQISLPGRPGVMTPINGRQILVADAYKNQVYQLDLSAKKLERTLVTLPNISAMTIYTPVQGRPELWVVSRSDNKVQVLDLANGTPLATLDVGEKPMAIAMVQQLPQNQPVTTQPAPKTEGASTTNKSADAQATPEQKTPETKSTQTTARISGPGEVRAYVLCSGADRLDILDTARYLKLESVQLPAGLFPTGMAIVPVDQRAYIAGAGKSGLTVVDLSRNTVEEAINVPFRTFALTMPSSLDGATAQDTALHALDKDKAPASEKMASPFEAAPNETVVSTPNAPKASKPAKQQNWFLKRPAVDNTAQEEAAEESVEMTPPPAPPSAIQRNAATPTNVSPALAPSHLSVPSSPGGIRFNTTAAGSKGVTMPINQMGQWFGKKRNGKVDVNHLPIMEVENNTSSENTVKPAENTGTVK